MPDIYFDNSATTRVSVEAAEAALNAMRECYGNPSSVHALGVAAAKLLAEARQALANCLHAAAEECYFCASGTEANNWAILGAAQTYARQGKRILISAIEHPSLLEPAKHLAERGYTVEHIPVLASGLVDLERLAALLRPDTIFVGLHQVNNEIGTVQPLTEVGALIRQLAPQAFFHIDGVQALGKLPIELAIWQADSYAVSGHKIHAPKGVGMLWLKRSRRLQPLLYGGGQEKGLRSGTENLPGIAAFAVVAQAACTQREANAAQLARVKAVLARGLLAIEEAYLNGPDLAAGAPHILNVSFPGTRSEVLLHSLEQRGVYVSAGSACSSHKTTTSHVLQALGLSAERQDGALRFSLCAKNTVEEAQTVLEAVQAVVAEVRALLAGGKRKGKR